MTIIFQIFHTEKCKFPYLANFCQQGHYIFFKYLHFSGVQQQRSPCGDELAVAPAGGGAGDVLRARLLVQHQLLRAQHQGGRDLPRQPAQHHRGRVHRPQPGNTRLSLDTYINTLFPSSSQFPGRPVLPRPSLQHQQEHRGGADAPTHRKGEEMRQTIQNIANDSHDRECGCTTSEGRSSRSASQSPRYLFR